MTRCQARRRRGAVAVESAIIYMVLFILLFGIIAGGLGVFRYQQVANLAREASRYASVHGTDWEADQGASPCQSADIIANAVTPLAGGLPVTVNVYWISGTTDTAYDWDTKTHRPTGTGPYGDTVSNRVRVTVSYQWFPEILVTGPVNLTSTSEVAISY